MGVLWKATVARMWRNTCHQTFEYSNFPITIPYSKIPPLKDETSIRFPHQRKVMKVFYELSSKKELVYLNLNSFHHYNSRQKSNCCLDRYLPYTEIWWTRPWFGKGCKEKSHHRGRWSITGLGSVLDHADGSLFQARRDIARKTGDLKTTLNLLSSYMYFLYAWYLISVKTFYISLSLLLTISSKW